MSAAAAPLHLQTRGFKQREYLPVVEHLPSSCGLLLVCQYLKYVCVGTWRGGFSTRTRTAHRHAPEVCRDGVSPYYIYKRQDSSSSCWCVTEIFTNHRYTIIRVSLFSRDNAAPSRFLFGLRLCFCGAAFLFLSFLGVCIFITVLLINCCPFTLSFILPL
jgi:hypothetical protein